MDVERVLPELREPMKRAQVSAPRWLVRTAVRLMPVPKSEAVQVERARAGAVRLRVYRPQGSLSGAGLLWIHGGGLLFGDARQDEALCLSTAERLGMVIVSANYRFAPEHPFPAAHDDVRAAWGWMLDHAASLGIDPRRLAVGGESAGAGLAAALVQRLADDGGVQPCAQWLFAPMLDDRTAARPELDAEQHFVWDNAANREGWSGYFGGPVGAETVPPYAAPGRRTDLAGLPPAFLTWGDIELFAAEDRAYAEALARAGVPVTSDIVEGAPHGFENWAKETPVAEALIGRAQHWLREAAAAR
ncbi:alpha/beta hydrolase [Herbiconiux flava]|uniref:Acetyl esterase/lipase n=1 Tax=Herbiconiux flava TaxID=881268 RepID=A0A852STE0_9MICO|nr:alpha/beta hydrolase [Herbiconiux flava]NYD72179.1 acetyl esterase/lipase [Herbiconiux flava]GLK17857.1 esterase [Herbiconiux flava]